MIKTKEDYIYFLECDRKAIGTSRKRPRIFGDELWKYQRLMRKFEYWSNSEPLKIRLITKIYTRFLHWKYKNQSIKYGFTIPINTFGPGLKILHRGTIVINGNAKVGKNCRINVDVNIGTQMGMMDECPVIGDNCFIGPGAKFFGKIAVGDNVAVGANSVVNKDVPNNVAIAGVPAKIINDNGTMEVFSYYIDK